jgi:hypothetical protein
MAAVLMVLRGRVRDLPRMPVAKREAVESTRVDGGF